LVLGIFERILNPGKYLLRIAVNSGGIYSLESRDKDFIEDIYDRAVAIIKNKSNAVLSANSINKTINVTNYGGNVHAGDGPMHTGSGDINQTYGSDYQSNELAKHLALLEDIVRRSNKMTAEEEFERLRSEALKSNPNKEIAGKSLKTLRQILGSVGDASAIIQAIITLMGISSSN
ncbi:hypothetical protein WDZ92_52970, partial [Nostoc sp. NIES-2111]